MARQLPPQRPYVLGLDLGANSMGWAALELEGPLVAGQAVPEPKGLLHPPEQMAEFPSMGVRIFEAGVADLGTSKEASRGLTRRMARLARRQTQRRARRMRKVFRVLQAAQLLPPFMPGAIDACGGQEPARDRLLKALDRQLAGSFEDSKQLHISHELLPYLLRARALDQRLPDEALGRALYHLAQRRGFKSNRKTDGKADKDDDSGKVKQAIGLLQSAIDAAGHRTLGEHLFHEGLAKKQLRRRYTQRSMYEHEFELLWTAQATHAPMRLTQDLKKALKQALFFQRPLRSQSDLIGACELENGGFWADLSTGELRHFRKRRRAPECLLASQRFRLLQKVNDLARLQEGGPALFLTPEERARLASLLEESEGLSFAEVKKLLGFPKGTHFNLEAGGEKKLKGNRTNAALLNLFQERWKALSKADRGLVVQELWGAPDDDVLRRRTEAHKGVWAKLKPTSSEVDGLLSLHLSDAYMSLSSHAMERLLPLMEQGKAYMTAVREAYGVPTATEVAEVLPPVDKALGELRNPIVSRALTELRRVVNALIAIYGKPQLIRIELARELKKSRDDRSRLEKNMRGQEEEREQAAACFVSEAGLGRDPKREDILRIQLWKECAGVCPYTGRSISMADLFGGGVDVEHILPFSRCLDDSFLNKTLCFAEFNRNVKGNRTPAEAFAADKVGFESMCARMRNNLQHGMPEEKLRRFQLADHELDDFLADFTTRQLNDTRHASRRGREYLARLYGGNLSTAVDPEGRMRVQVGNGQITALLRRSLGLPRLLQARTDNKRDDHRHHAVDALAIALTSPSMTRRIQAGAEQRWQERRRLLSDVPLPWNTFSSDAAAALEGIVVSHRVNARVRGSLHEETLLSPRRDAKGAPTAEGGCAHVRKPLERLSPAETLQIVDPAIQAIVLKKLAGRAPKDAFVADQPNTYPCMPSGVPIRRVRIKKTTRPLTIGKGHRQRQADSAENHHVELCAVVGKKGLQWKGRVVSLAEAMERKRRGLDVVARTDDLLFSLVKNDLISLLDDDGVRRPYLVRKFSQFESGRLEIGLVLHTDARRVGDIGKEMQRLGSELLRKRGCRKLTALPIGVARPCRA